jgi:hypothetical protein
VVLEVVRRDTSVTSVRVGGSRYVQVCGILYYGLYLIGEDNLKKDSDTSAFLAQRGFRPIRFSVDLR